LLRQSYPLETRDEAARVPIDAQAVLQRLVHKIADAELYLRLQTPCTENPFPAEEVEHGQVPFVVPVARRDIQEGLIGGLNEFS